MRGAERPGKIKWTRPFLGPLEPLTDNAAMQTFADIADESDKESIVRQLLHFSGNLPLAICLIAGIAAYEGCENTLNCWKTENTRLLSDGYDKTSSLDISIMLSFTSSRMTKEAQDLLSLLSILPDGLLDADLVQSQLPIPNILASKATLIRTSLAYTGNDQRLKVLVPIREHVSSTYPPRSSLKLSLRQYFHEVLNIWGNINILRTEEMVSQISVNTDNLNALLLDAITADYPDEITSLQGVIFFLDFHSQTNRVLPSGLMTALSNRILNWQSHPIYGHYLIQSFNLARSRDVDNLIDRGNEHFQHCDLLEQGIVQSTTPSHS